MLFCVLSVTIYNKHINLFCEANQLEIGRLKVTWGRQFHLLEFSQENFNEYVYQLGDDITNINFSVRQGCVTPQSCNQIYIDKLHS